MSERVVLITGAKGGLGLFVTQRFVATGATVVGASRSIAQEDFPVANFAALPVDFTRAAAVHGAINSVIDRYGRLDVLVHVWAALRAECPWRKPMTPLGRRCAT